MRIIMALGVASAICGLPALSPASAASAKFQTLHSFGSAPNDGGFPSAGLIAVKGMLYGTTESGGQNFGGSVYAIDPTTGSETTINNTNVNGPTAPVTLYEHNLYGTSSIGINTIFSVDLKTKQVTTLYNFPDGGDDEPASPNGLTEFGGKLFGTTFAGDNRGCGYVFSLDAATDVFTILHKFICRRSGGNPLSLTLYRGLLYGATVEGGPKHAGTIFSVDPVSGVETTLYPEGVWADGVTFHDGVMLGSASYSGTGGNGTLFSFDLATRQFKVIYAFPGGASGCNPQGAPVRYHGKLYGVASACGDSGNDGLMFEVSLKTGVERVLHKFTNGADGANPGSTLLLYNGALYGTTKNGGAYGSGTVFRYAP